MAEEVEMTPVDAAEPPKADPLAKPVAKIPEVPAASGALKPGLKLPPKPGLAAGLKLPPKPGATVALKPGLKLPPKPGTTVALKPGLKLPPKPVIRKPGATVTAAPLPKPVSAPLPKPVTAEAPAAAKPVAVDAQGVGKLPTVEAKAVARDDVKPVVSDNPKPLEALKSVTQKLKGITQEIPQQAILRKTGIIADAAMSEAQKEAAKHKTARISLSDAMGVAPVKNENAPMKTIRIKRPVGIPGATATLTPQPNPAAGKPEVQEEVSSDDPPTAVTMAIPTVTQRKTLKIARPGGGAVRPSGKFGLKRPSQATTIAAQAPAAAPEAGEAPAVADIPDMPAVPPMPMHKAADEGPAWAWTLSTLVQLAACVAIGALAFFLWQNAQTRYF